MADIELEIGFKNSKGSIREVKKLKGSLSEVEKMIRKMDLSSFPADVEVSEKKMKQLANEIRRGAGHIAKMGGKARVVAESVGRVVTKTDKLGRVQYRIMNQEGKLSRLVSKKRAEEVDRLSIIFKRSSQAAQSSGALSRQIHKVIKAAKSRAINDYVSQIAQMRKEMRLAGVSTQKQAEFTENLHRALRKIKGMDVSKATSRIMATGGGVDEARAFAGRYESRQRGGRRAELNAARSQFRSFVQEQAALAGRFGASMKRMAQQVSGALGFTLIDIGTNMQRIFSGKRFEGQISGASSEIAGAVGSVFGSAVGDIARDIGRFAGTIGEIFANSLTWSIRKAGLVVGSFVKGLGYTIASGLLAAFGGGPLGLAIAGFTLIAGITTILQSIMSLVSEAIDEIMDILSKAFKAMTALITAGFKIIGSIFKAATKLLTTLWNGLWSGITKIVKEGSAAAIDAISKFTSSAVKTFMQVEAGATKASKELVDKYGTNIGQFVSMIGRGAAKTGFELADVQRAVFDTVSSGFRDVSEANKILSSSSNLAIADMAELGTATNAVITVWQNYKGKVKDVAEVSRTLAAATTLGRTSMEEIGPSLRHVIGMASNLDISLKEVMVAWMHLTRVFGRGSAASTSRYLNRMIESIYMPGSTGQKEMESLGVNIREIQDAVSSGRASAGGGLVELMEKLGKVKIQDLRKIFRTLQARKASLAFGPEGVKNLKTMLGDFDKVSASFGKQVALGKKLSERVLKRVYNTIKNIQTVYGGIVTKTIKWLFFNTRIEKLFDRLNRILFSKQMRKRMQDVVDVLKGILLPVARMIYFAFKGIVKLFEDFALGNLFNVDDLRSVVQSLISIVKHSFDFVRSLKLGEKLMYSIHATAMLLGKTLPWVSKLLSNIGSPNEMFGQVEDLWGKYKKPIVDFANNVATYLKSRFTEIIASIGIWIGESKIDMNEILDFKGFGTTFQSIALTIKIALMKVFKDVVLYFVEALNQSTNSWLMLLKGYLKDMFTLVNSIARIIETYKFMRHPGKYGESRGKQEARGVTAMRDLNKQGGLSAKPTYEALTDIANATKEGIEKGMEPFEAYVKAVSSTVGANKSFAEYVTKTRKLRETDPASYAEISTKIVDGVIGKLSDYASGGRLNYETGKVSKALTSTGQWDPKPLIQSLDLKINDAVKILEDIKKSSRESANNSGKNVSDTINKAVSTFNQSVKARSLGVTDGEMAKSRKAALIKSFASIKGSVYKNLRTSYSTESTTDAQGNITGIRGIRSDNSESLNTIYEIMRGVVEKVARDRHSAVTSAMSSGNYDKAAEMKRQLEMIPSIVAAMGGSKKLFGGGMNATELENMIYNGMIRALTERATKSTGRWKEVPVPGSNSTVTVYEE